MPSMDNVRKAQERREARASRKTANVQASEEQEKELAALSDRLRGVSTGNTEPFGTPSTEQGTGGTNDAGDDGDELKQTTKAKNVSRNSRKVQAQLAAEAQAEVDLKNTTAADDPDEEIDLSQYRATGRDVPLHVLNKLASRADKVVRDEAREVAQAVGKLTFAELTGRAPERSRYARNRRLAENISEMQKLRNAQKTDAS